VERSLERRREVDPGERRRRSVILIFVFLSTNKFSLSVITESVIKYLF